MKIHYITIEGIESRGKLKLSDKGLTKVNPGDIVIWNIEPDEGVVQINQIKKDENSNNIFTIGPNKIQRANAWIGVVNDELKHAEESYSIAYTAKDKAYSFDPKIQVNP